MFNSEQEVQECDATMFNNSIEAGLIKEIWGTVLWDSRYNFAIGFWKSYL